MLRSDCRLKICEGRVVVNLFQQNGGELFALWLQCIRLNWHFGKGQVKKKKLAKKPTTVPSNLSQKQLVIFSSAHTQPVSQGRSVFFTAAFGVKSPVLSLSQTVQISVWIYIITFPACTKIPSRYWQQLKNERKQNTWRNWSTTYVIYPLQRWQPPTKMFHGTWVSWSHFCFDGGEKLSVNGLNEIIGIFRSWGKDSP